MVFSVFGFRIYRGEKPWEPARSSVGLSAVWRRFLGTDVHWILLRAALVPLIGASGAISGLMGLYDGDLRFAKSLFSFFWGYSTISSAGYRHLPVWLE